MSRYSWMLETPTLPKLAFLGEDDYGYISLVKSPDGLLMAKRTSFEKYSEKLEKEVEIMTHFKSHCFNFVRAITPLVYHETIPNNVKVCSFYMDLAPHGSLQTMIAKSDNRLPSRVVQFCTYKILEALDIFHEQGYVHCNLTPANLLIFPSYTHGELCNLKLSGFGSAKVPNGADPLKGSLYKGLHDYLAPEAEEADTEIISITSAIDIWALGAMVFEMYGIKACDTPFNMISEGMYPFVTNEGWDFMKLCREKCFRRRKSAKELLKHPFVVDEVEYIDEVRDLIPLVPDCIRDGTVQGRFF